MENSTNSQTNDFPSVPLDGSFQAISEATSRSNRNEEQRQEKAKTSAEISIMAQAEWNALRVAANDQNNLSLKKKSWLFEVWLFYYSSPYVRDSVRFLKKSQTSCMRSSPEPLTILVTPVTPG